MPVNPYIPFNHVYNQYVPYYMLPICNNHNNTSRCNITMFAHHKEDLMELKGFRANLIYGSKN